MTLYKIVMVRHGESEWNQQNLFSGWYDSVLSKKGIEEAENAGKILQKAGYKFDIAYTSVLRRAQKTLEIILEEIGQTDLPVVESWRLNERHYGGLIGLSKTEMAVKYGEEQVAIWRRSYDIPPPPMEPDHPYYDNIVKDPRYKDEPPPDQFPKFESLKMTIERILPFWNGSIVPQIKSGKKVLISTHGNTLRAIVKDLDQIADNEIMNLNIPTGFPFVYTLNENMKPTPDGSLQYLGNPESVRKAVEVIVAQGKGN